jgi:hypothetical protein
MPVASDYQLELRAEILQLARDMIRLEQWAKDAAERSRWPRVAELHTLREQVVERRSDLLRQYWCRRRCA